MSHPVWVRGLKPANKQDAEAIKAVAPRVGAWIETSRTKMRPATRYVAPRVGAWIET